MARVMTRIGLMAAVALACANVMAPSSAWSQQASGIAGTVRDVSGVTGGLASGGVLSCSESAGLQARSISVAVNAGKVLAGACGIFAVGIAGDQPLEFLLGSLSPARVEIGNGILVKLADLIGGSLGLTALAHPPAGTRGLRLAYGTGLTRPQTERADDGSTLRLIVSRGGTCRAQHLDQDDGARNAHARN